MSCLTCWMLVGVANLGQPGPATATKVAVVNVPVVSERYLKTSYLESQFETRRLELAGQRDALKEKMDRTMPCRTVGNHTAPNVQAWRWRAAFASAEWRLRLG